MGQQAVRRTSCSIPLVSKLTSPQITSYAASIAFFTLVPCATISAPSIVTPVALR